MKSLCAAAVVAFGLGMGIASAAESAAPSSLPAAVKDGKIAYALTSRHWALYQTEDGKTECPTGFNEGPREQLTQLFPNDGKPRTIVETQLMREGRQWFPTTEPEPFPFKDAASKVSYGMNLDGKVKDGDFTGVDGEKGVDNQLYRALGCIASYRLPLGSLTVDEDQYVRRYNYNRLLIELSGVDSLVNDDDVTVKSYHGLDPVLTDATGVSFIPGGTQQVDRRWGKFIETTWKGKIVDGVLITEPADLTLPASASFGTSAFHVLKGYRFRLKLTPERGEGLMAGYVEVAAFIKHLNSSWATPLQSYGQLSSPSLYRALRRLADGYPDPKTGEMMAISSAMDVKFIQVHLNQPLQKTSEAGKTPQLFQPASGKQMAAGGR